MVHPRGNQVRTACRRRRLDARVVVRYVWPMAMDDRIPGGSRAQAAKPVNSLTIAIESRSSETRMFASATSVFGRVKATPRLDENWPLGAANPATANRSSRHGPRVNAAQLAFHQVRFALERTRWRHRP